MTFNQSKSHNIFLAFLLITFFSISSTAQSSGCDPRRFYTKGIIHQIVLQNYKEISLEEKENIIAKMTKSHRPAITFWSKPPLINNESNISLIMTIYNDLDTDCGWHPYDFVSIIHLEIKDRSEKVILYPDLISDIDAELIESDHLISFHFKI